MRLAVAVGLVSAAALAFEVLLVRCFAIAQWHHLAYMVISVALLGYGASGTALCFVRERLLRRFAVSFAVFALLFAVFVVTGMAAVRAIPLNLLELTWSPGQAIHLFGITAVLAVPFFCAASAIGLALARAREQVGPVYRSDLIGAAGGASGVVLALTFWDVAAGLKIVAWMGCVAAAVALSMPGRRPLAIAASLVLAAVTVAWPSAWLEPEPSEYKPLSQALAVPGTSVIAQRSNAIARLDVVESRVIPFRYAPGLGLRTPAGPPEQMAVYTDGEGPTAITRFDGDFDRLAYLDHQTAALPFHLVRHPHVLVIGAGGGADVLLALAQGASRVDAVELNSDMIDLVQGPFAAFSGRLYDRTDVRVHIDDGRSFVARTGERFDVIHLALLDSLGAASAGMQALSAGSLYTVEAFGTYLDRLTPEGILSVTRWLKVPPRDELKLFATAVEALSRRGVTKPGEHLALVRSWSTATLLVRNAPFDDGDRAAVRAFARERGFDLGWLPGLTAEEANRYNILERAYDFEGAVALLGPVRDAFIADYKFDLRPATDDRPYFFHFLKPATMVELLRMPPGANNLVEWGYPILLATLAQAVIGSLVIILLPLSVLGRGGRPSARSRGLRTGVVLYFAAIGLAFLFVEIAFIQRLQIFLGHPIYAVSATLTAFLLFAGLGAGQSRRWEGTFVRIGGNPGVSITACAAAATAVAVLSVLLLAAIDPLLARGMALPLGARAVIAVALIAPLAFMMGMPFPLALGIVAGRAPSLVPWAWAVNGCASVISAVLATLIALHAGFSVLVLAAAALYGLAGVTILLPAFRKEGARGTPGRPGPPPLPGSG